MQNLKKILKNKKGFTLVELMVVVAILGILVAVAVPVYNNVTDEAKRNTCDSNVRTIESAIMTYEISHDPIAASTTNTGLKGYLVPNYLEEMPQCPYDDDKETDGGDYSIDASGKVVCNGCGATEEDGE
ncbi:prepilin-type N-terminal cleavage/methylation domain-containing protein [Gemmiger sp. An50]|uniref:competence type IV pilus major pilin ComGC n=1 Tax=Gemmiger sp. An50 TaxID=1965639 RepID=UPI0013A64DD8|nr:prepilin-type N-terminal cleavage/methylation domain-containing protein [Gemmiger sp. An50]